MAHAARTARPGISFVTIATRERRPIFSISRVAEIFIDTLLHYRTRGFYKLHAFLVMPDHVHLLLTPESASLAQAIERVQEGFAHRLSTTHALWEPGFTAYRVHGLRDLETLRAYLHETPVRAELCPSPELYAYSSAHRLPESSSSTTTSATKLAS